MKQIETKEYWRWKMVRQVSVFVNDPSAENSRALTELIEGYADKFKQMEQSGEHHGLFEPSPAEFVCTMDV